MLEKSLGVVLERTGGQGLEHFPEFLLGSLHPTQLLRVSLALLRQRGSLELRALVRGAGFLELDLETLDPAGLLFGPGLGLGEPADLRPGFLDPQSFLADLLMRSARSRARRGMPGPHDQPGYGRAGGSGYGKKDNIHGRQRSVVPCLTKGLQPSSRA